jgi:hypothetical protein
LNLSRRTNVHLTIASISEGRMSRNGLYTLIGVLLFALVAVGGYLIYDQSQKPKLEIRLDQSGIQVQGNG